MSDEMMENIIMESSSFYYGKDEATALNVTKKIVGTLVGKGIGRSIKGERRGKLILDNKQLNFISKGIMNDFIINIKLKDIIFVDRRSNIKSGKVGKMLMVYWKNEDENDDSAIFYPTKGIMSDGDRWYNSLIEIVGNNETYNEYYLEKGKGKEKEEEEEDGGVSWDDEDEADNEDEVEEKILNKPKETKFCSECGAKNRRSSKFCSECGSKW